ncbi:hypothetical protein PHYPSEUDO_003639 [Phytophthora pseudosyringae]|uniref:Uncharacterized protein n=1 Tax=Phytophthora pseudosyringae TaxID=221518 RepID=A0A8T1VQE4_9STRA|nr:hypothetical protein PHYPSEUDO_003639 [Phytophthora pseudosyringae]
MCTEEGNFAKLKEMFGHAENETSTLNAAENVWNYCRVQIVRHDGRLLTRGETFLNSCNASDVGDNWCGYSALGLVPPKGSSPFLENPGMFEFFRTEWPKRVWFDSVLLGLALCCMMLVFLKSNGEMKSRETNEKLDMVEEKTAQETQV